MFKKIKKKLVLLVLLTTIIFFIYFNYYPKDVNNLSTCNFIINSIKKQECISNVAQNLGVEKAISICSDLKDHFIKDVCLLNLIKPIENLNKTIKKNNQKICNLIIDLDIMDNCKAKMNNYHLAVMSKRK